MQPALCIQREAMGCGLNPQRDWGGTLAVLGCVGQQVGQQLRQPAGVADHATFDPHLDVDVLPTGSDRHFFCNLFKRRLQGVAFLERDRNASSQPPLAKSSTSPMRPSIRVTPAAMCASILLALGCCLTFQ